MLSRTNTCALDKGSVIATTSCLVRTDKQMALGPRTPWPARVLRYHGSVRFSRPALSTSQITGVRRNLAGRGERLAYHVRRHRFVQILQRSYIHPISCEGCGDPVQSCLVPVYVHHTVSMTRTPSLCNATHKRFPGSRLCTMPKLNYHPCIVIGLSVDS